MPTVLRVQGYRFYFYSHEPNEPPHVHIDRGGNTAKFRPDGATLARSAGFNARELAFMRNQMHMNAAQLTEACHGHFGTGN